MHLPLSPPPCKWVLHECAMKQNHHCYLPPPLAHTKHLQDGHIYKGSGSTSFMLSHPGDCCKDEKVALTVLCKVLPKKSVNDAVVYLYLECKVRNETPLIFYSRKAVRGHKYKAFG